jgi:ABC-2 type transport system ATP-binding protein
MNATKNAIETHDLCKTFIQRQQKITVVDKLNLTVPSGVVFGYLGPNGAGKTTTIRLLTGVLTPTSGRATVAGLDLAEPERVKSQIGYANQSASVYGDLTVLENLRFKAGLFLHPRLVAAAVERVIEQLGLAPYRQHLASQLSGGWRQRLSIGTAMIHGPRLLFLDEPTAGLDPVARRDLWDAIYALTQSGTTVFVTTHYMDEAERCQELAMIAGGHMLAQGTPEALRRGLPGRCFELAAQDLASDLAGSLALALPRLKAIAGVRDVWISGASLRLSTSADFDLGRLAGVIGEASQQARPVAATLEDVFVDLANQYQQTIKSQGVAA